MTRITLALAGAPGTLVGSQPIHQLERWEQTGLYRSIGDDPQLLLELPQGKLEAGFYRITVELKVLDGTLGIPILYVHDVPVPMHSQFGGSEWTAIILAPKSGVSHVRLDPADRPALFLLGTILVQALSEREAIEALSDDLRRKPPAGYVFVSGALENQALALYERYVARDHDGLSLPAQVAGTYEDWVKQFDTFNISTVLQWRQDAITWPRHPFFSVLVPVYNTEERWLRECIESVRSQAYPYWELCIADDASPAPHVRRVLEEYAGLDSRVRLYFRETNGHISLSSNSALHMARGEFIALLDHDDLLPPHALLEMARVIVARPGIGLIFSDEDKVDETGKRYDPYFKPSWNPDLFLSQNYVSHFGVYRTSLVLEVGGFRAGYEGSQDYDLALRCVEKLSEEQIVHIPRVLYHWRAISGSTALGLGEKSYAVDAGKRALEDHLDRTGVKATVAETAGGYRVRRALPEKPPAVELIIPTRDRVDLLRLCIESIREKTTYDDYTITIVDNNSVEQATWDYLDVVVRDPRVRVLRDDGPFNYSRLNNMAASQSRADIIGLVNNDIEVISPDWLGEMVSQALRPEVGVVGAMLYYPDDTIQHAGVIIGMHGVAGHVYKGAERGHTGQMGRSGLIQNLSAVTAACLLVRRSVWSEVAGLDESLTVAFNDIDLCLRIAKAGYLNVWTPFAELYHHESASRGYEDTPEKKARFEGEIAVIHGRWAPWLQADPAHNPNLSLYSFGMVPAFPPRDVGPRFGGRAGTPA